MTGYDLYVFVFCLVTFAFALILFGTMLFIIVCQELRAIENGQYDRKIVSEYRKKIPTKRSSVEIVFRRFCAVVAFLLAVVFALALGLRFSENKAVGRIPTPRVVLSDSMSYKRETNTYLEENGLDDQFDTFDLIITRQLPDEFELELYDVVVYEIRGELVIHRIIQIEEPNEKHPEHRLFYLRGDAVKYSDEKAVEYSQMKAIYRGEKIRFVGSFVYFIQSPAGYICIILVIFALILEPIIEKIILRRKLERYNDIRYYNSRN